MKEYKKKWNKYEKGKVPWINSRKTHPSRRHFINYVEENFPSGKILEIGGGELIEAKEITRSFPDVQYSVADISNFFLDACKGFDSITGYEADMTNLPFKDKEFDLVFASSVLEHSPDIVETISELSRVSNSFYFTMFKWKMITGNLLAEYRIKKRYFSTMFNIDDLFELIETHGIIHNSVMCFEDGSSEIKFDIYRKKDQNQKDIHRTGDRLIIIGEWNLKKEQN